MDGSWFFGFSENILDWAVDCRQGDGGSQHVDSLFRLQTKWSGEPSRYAWSQGGWDGRIAYLCWDQLGQWEEEQR